MVKFHPSLAAVKESSSERRSTSKESKAPFVQPSREASPKVAHPTPLLDYLTGA